MVWPSCCVRQALTCKSNWFLSENLGEGVQNNQSALRPVSLLILSFQGRTLGGGPETGRSVLGDRRRICKGAFGKTSGRSNFPNAPLRATSSASKRSMSDAIAKALPTCIDRTRSRVGFARDWKLLR